jgi:hypothetical protein
MKIGLDRAVNSFIGFMADQVAQIPKLGDRFLAYAALGSLKANPAVITAKVRPWGEMAGLVSDDKVDLDLLKASFTEAFAQVPKVSYFGFSFTQDDADALLKRMLNAGET